MIISLLLAAALAGETIAPTPSSAAEPPKTPAAAGPTYAPARAKDAKPDQVVCKSEPVLGSRLPARRCHTVAEIQDRELQDRQAIEHAQIVQEPSK